MISVDVDSSAYEVVQQINRYLRLHSSVLDWLKLHAGANMGFARGTNQELVGDWCWDYIGSYPNLQVRVYFKDPSVAMLFKLMWGGSV